MRLPKPKAFLMPILRILPCTASVSLTLSAAPLPARRRLSLYVEVFFLINFPTMYDRPPTPVTDSGSGVRPVFSSRFDDRGVLVVEETGKDDLYASIQSHADSCCVDTIIRRYNCGDMTALSQRQGLFLDTTVFPSSFADLLNVVRDHQQAFDTLPADLRSKFGNNFAAWASAAGTTDWLNILNEYATQHSVASESDGGDVVRES